MVGALMSGSNCSVVLTSGSAPSGFLALIFGFSGCIRGYLILNPFGIRQASKCATYIDHSSAGLFNPFGVLDYALSLNRGLHPRLLSFNPFGILLHPSFLAKLNNIIGIMFNPFGVPVFHQSVYRRLHRRLLRLNPVVLELNP